MKNSQLIIGITFILLFWFSLQPAIDPDTGWHIATGRYIVTHHAIPQTDPFSFSLPNHPYIAHAWGTDVVMYAVDKLAGPIGLSVLFALLTTVFFAISYATINRQSSSTIHPFWLLIVAYPAIEIIGQRPQVITIIGLAWLLNLLSNGISSQKMWQIPLLFLFWANLHGGVVLGLVTFGLWLGLSYRNNSYTKATNALWLKCFLLSSITTLINPYSYHLYTFALGMVTNQTSMIYNSDWVPLFSSRLSDDSLILRVCIVAGSAIAILDQKKQTILRTIAILFLVLAFKSLRYVVPLLPVIILLIIPTLQNLLSTNTKSKWLVLSFTFLVLSFKFSVLFNKTEVICSRQLDCYARQAEMPYGAVNFMTSHHLSGRIFNFYTWGGYLSWQLPASQVFIDGRMDNFFISGRSFLTEFVAIEEQQSGWQELLMSYHPQFALIPANWHGQQQALVAGGWQTLYQDNIAVLMKLP